MNLRQFFKTGSAAIALALTQPFGFLNKKRFKMVKVIYADGSADTTGMDYFAPHNHYIIFGKTLAEAAKFFSDGHPGMYHHQITYQPRDYLGFEITQTGPVQYFQIEHWPMESFPSRLRAS